MAWQQEKFPEDDVTSESFLCNWDLLPTQEVWWKLSVGCFAPCSSPFQDSEPKQV